MSGALVAAVAAAAAAAAVAAGGSVAAQARLARLGREHLAAVGRRSPLRTQAAPTPSRRSRDPRSRLLAAATAGAAVALVVGGAAGAALGGAAAVVGHRWLATLSPAGRIREEQRCRAELPLMLDLLGACLQAGLPVASAVAAVRGAVDEVLAARLAPVATALELGAGNDDAWLALADDEVLGPVARTMLRAGRTGAPPADVVLGLATRQREVLRADYERAAQAVGVSSVAPLTVCFLPAFVLVGVVPVIWGLLGPVLAAAH